MTTSSASIADSNRRRLRSSSSSQLVIRRTRLSTVGDRAFPVAGSLFWNRVPPDVTSAPTTPGCPECCGSPSDRSSTPWPCLANTTQPLLATSTTTSYCQVRRNRVEVCQRRRSDVSIRELCVPVEDVRGRPRLRSASTRCISLPRVQTSTGQRSFAYSGPAVWNLPSLREHVTGCV